MVDGIVRMSLKAVHPLAKYMHVWVRGNESPSVVMEQHAKFLSHCLVPIWVAKDIGEGRRFKRERDSCSVVRRKGIASVRGRTIRH